MIAHIKGTISDLKPMECIIDVHGVGYRVHIPLSAYKKLKSEQQTHLHVYTLHKEDSFKLYGFTEKIERYIFSILLKVQGIGPAVALSILSGIEISDLVQSVRDQDKSMLVKIPGIGQGKAEKLLFELKRKQKLFDEISLPEKGNQAHINQAVEALVTLGYNEAKARDLSISLTGKNPEIDIETLIKEALKLLS